MVERGKGKAESETAARIVRSLERLLTPVVRILLRYGISFRAFSEAAKRVYVDVASNEFTLEGRKLSSSRISVLTGLDRREVAKMRKIDDPDPIEERINRAARVIAGWRRDGDFSDSRGRPLTLAFEGESGTFNDLVKLYGGDIPARATLDELIRVGAVKETKDGRYRLVARAYVPGSSELDAIDMLGSHVPDLIKSIDHNMLRDSAEPFFQRRVVYDNIPEEHADKLRGGIQTQGQRFLERLDSKLSKSDRDADSSVEGTGRRRVVLGVYYLDEDLEEN